MFQILERHWGSLEHLQKNSGGSQSSKAVTSKLITILHCFACDSIWRAKKCNSFSQTRNMMDPSNTCLKPNISKISTYMQHMARILDNICHNHPGVPSFFGDASKNATQTVKFESMFLNYSFYLYTWQ